MDKKIELLKTIPSVTVIAVHNDRVYIEADPRDVKIVEPFKSARAGALDNTALARSMKTQIFYPPLLYGQVKVDILELLCVDGMQRLLSALENHTEKMVFQLILTWDTPMQAFEAAISANSIRHEPTDVDILSIFRKGISVVRMLEITTESETNLRRLERISRHSDLDECVKNKYFSSGQLSSSLEKCKGDYGRERRFVDYISDQVRVAKAKAAKAQAYINKCKNKKVDAAQRKKAEIVTHLKNIPWADIKLELAKDDQTGPLKVSQTSSGDVESLRCGDSEEWSKFLALYGPFGKPHDKVALEDLEEFVLQLPFIKKKIQSIIKRKKHESAPAMDTDNPAAPEEVEERLDDQDDDFVAGDDELDDEDGAGE